MALTDKTLSGAERFAAALATLGMDYRVSHFDETTRTAAEAAAAIGCDLSQIAKSLVFRSATTDQQILVIASGANRVDERLLAAILADRVGHEEILRADAAYVRLRTGYAIGGVAPIGHVEPLAVVIDTDLLDHATVWAAAGTPNAVFELPPTQLIELTGGIKATIVRRV